MDTNSQPALRRAALGHLPDEMMLRIVENLDVVEDISALTRVSRGFHALFIDHLIDTHIKKAVTNPTMAAVELFLHAIKIDETTIVDSLMGHHRDLVDLCGLMPLEGLEEATFLDFAMTADAPKVAVRLCNTGGSTDNGKAGALKLDQMRLCLALALDPASQGKLDAALRIACSYALPRTARMLLTRGADPNSVSTLGATPIHIAVAKREKPALLKLSRPYTGSRLAWKDGRLGLDPGVNLFNHNHWVERMKWQAILFEDPMEGWTAEGGQPHPPGHVCVGLGSKHATLRPSKPKYVPFTTEQHLWDEKITDTITALLDFGAEALTPRAPPTRAHKCDHTCWRSLNCSHRGQTAVHLAAASGLPKAISLLMSRADTDPLAPDSDGYTPLYAAIANGETETVKFLLGFYNIREDPNPVVATTCPGMITGITTSALHAAARLAAPPIITAILDRGTDPNYLESDGRHAMDEVLANQCPTREADIVASIRALHQGIVRDEEWIEANTRDLWKKLEPFKHIGAKHPLELVRKMFFEVTANRVSRLRRGPTAEQMREERLAKEGKIPRAAWTDDPYDARLPASGGGGEAEADFPEMALGNGSNGAARGPGRENQALGGWSQLFSPSGGMTTNGAQRNWARAATASNTRERETIATAPVGRPGGGKKKGSRKGKPLQW